MIGITAIAGLVLGQSQVGLAPGTSFAAFEPYWVTGPYADTNQCPVCEYGMLPMVYAYFKLPNQNVLPVAEALQKSVEKYGKANLRTFVLDANLSGSDKTSKDALKLLAGENKFPLVSFMYRPKSLQAAVKNHGLQVGEWESLIYFVKDRKVVSVLSAKKGVDLRAGTIATRIDQLMSTK